MTIGHKHDVEFDEFAHDYDAGMSHPVKRMLGDSAAAFIDVKVRWLERSLQNRQRTSGTGRNPNLLDFGCGDGLFLQRIQQHGIACSLHGCDVSAGMLSRALGRFAENAPSFGLIANGRMDYEDNTFDVAIVSAVLHHIEPADRPAVYKELNRVLGPGGICIVFEHNLYHPIVQYMVASTPIDRNAKLLSPYAVRRGLEEAGFTDPTRRWLMFFPPRWKWCRPIEKWLEVVPLGGQYVVTAKKPATN